MADNRPEGRRRRRGLQILLMVAALAAVALLGVWLWPSPTPPPPAPPPAAATAPPTPVVAPNPPALTRTELIQAAEARAQGEPAADPGAKDPLADRRFRLAIPFGCLGPQIGAGASQAYYEVDAERRTLRLVARPVALAQHPVIAGLPDPNEIEAAEGFWIPRPWARSETCPPRQERPAPATPTPPSPPTLGLAMLFETGSSRLKRRGERPYELVRKVPEDEPLPLDQSFRLVLEGRLKAYPSGGVLRCTAESPDHRPVCLYSITLERVAFETPEGQQLVEWLD